LKNCVGGSLVSAQSLCSIDDMIDRVSNSTA